MVKLSGFEHCVQAGSAPRAVWSKTKLEREREKEVNFVKDIVKGD